MRRERDRFRHASRSKPMKTSSLGRPETLTPKLATSLERCAGPGEKRQDRAGARGGSDSYFQHGDQGGSGGGVFQFRLV
jgi:hypothetical protein